ncbi:MAG TPA: NAD(P)H-dependent oxidoreductase subunit E [Egibacteraceae bacterium]|nr:NAD(P)H-dependent oxidoreductase subunit E [Egibacteraceae bacterium]
MTFSPELRESALELIGRYPVARSALLPLLHLVQVQDGYISKEGLAECAELLGLTKAEVGAVATFYTMYKREPMGEHLVSVCTNFSCKVRGGQEVFDRLSEKLGVGHNGTTPDGTFTLEHAECLGNCEGAPVVTVDYLNYECVSADEAERLVNRIAAGEVPPPTRGMIPPGVRRVEYRLAGLGPMDPAKPGVASDQARADDGAVPTPEAGPGVLPVTVEPSLSPEDVAEREEARRQVREAGYAQQAVEGEGGPQSREFPTRPQEGDPISDQPTEQGLDTPDETENE